jgi:hypothetical protein
MFGTPPADCEPQILRHLLDANATLGGPSAPAFVRIAESGEIALRYSFGFDRVERRGTYQIIVAAAEVFGDWKRATSQPAFAINTAALLRRMRERNASHTDAVRSSTPRHAVAMTPTRILTSSIRLHETPVPAGPAAAPKQLPAIRKSVSCAQQRRA